MAIAIFDRVESLTPLLDATLFEALPRSYLERNGIFPIVRSGTDLVIATTNLTVVVDDVLNALHCRAARLVLVTPTDYRRLWMLTDLRRNQDEKVLASAVVAGPRATDQMKPRWKPFARPKRATSCSRRSIAMTASTQSSASSTSVCIPIP